MARTREGFFFSIRYAEQNIPVRRFGSRSRVRRVRVWFTQYWRTICMFTENNYIITQYRTRAHCDEERDSGKLKSVNVLVVFITLMCCADEVCVFAVTCRTR